MKTEQIAGLLREHQLKVTPQRLKIVDSLNRYGHLNIDKMYAEVKKAYPNISLATLYKNIAIMTQNTLLEEVKVPDEKPVYELKKNPHLHLHCERCGKIEDIDLPTDTLRMQAQEQSGFRIHSSCVIFRGTCAACADEV